MLRLEVLRQTPQPSPMTCRSHATQAGKGRSPRSGGQECSRKCHEESCDGFGIKYGKYCGVTNTGGQVAIDIWAFLASPRKA